jgi:hypothetical protein
VSGKGKFFKEKRSYHFTNKKALSMKRILKLYKGRSVKGKTLSREWSSRLRWWTIGIQKYKPLAMR